ncbi:MAG TPA: protein kinase [Candidatus Krumholzibacteria bacterium]|nr:protein kinase [Candidatus Krumholzibacteria bacterium]
MIGRKLLHYDVLESLGEGGMGVVYKAMDTRLNRPVALKFISPARVGDAQERARLVNEARSAAALRHPNICTVYDIEETPDGQTFISMAYLEGESLRDRILKQGRLPVEESVRIVTQVAEGLREAHARGVVHRDIKSANILLTERGEAVILDFGLAKLPSSASVTQTDTFSGTVAYSSPEQIRGERTDPRTDLWSLGVVWYEMLAGALPFNGDSVPAAIHAVLETAPSPIRSVRDDVPTGVEQAISHLLTKPVAQRTPDATTLLSEIKTLSTGGGAVRKATAPSIAVLPFANMSNDPEQSYFCDGIAEDIINDLTRIEGLRVAARTTSFAHRAASVDIRDIGRKIGVDSVLEGSVPKAGNRLRITAQLIDVSNGYHIWSERWDRDLADVFAIQDEISRAITAALRVKLSPHEKEMLGTPGTTDLKAYDLFLQGRRMMGEGQRGLRESRLLFQAALDRDPKFARAHAMLALAGIFLGNFFPGAEDLLTLARESAEQALMLDPNLAEAHTAKAHLLSSMGEMTEAEQNFKKALQLNPDLYEARYFYGRLFFVQRDWAKVIEQWERAIEIDPEEYQCACLIDAPYRGMGWTLEQRQPLLERALERVRAYAARHPESSRAYYLGSGVLFELGRREEGLDWVEQALRVDPLDSFAHYNVACTLALAGELERAVNHIERALDLGFAGVTWLESDPDLNPIREFPRFQAAVRKMREKNDSR